MGRPIAKRSPARCASRPANRRPAHSAHIHAQAQISGWGERHYPIGRENSTPATAPFISLREIRPSLPGTPPSPQYYLLNRVTGKGRNAISPPQQAPPPRIRVISYYAIQYQSRRSVSAHPPMSIPATRVYPWARNSSTYIRPSCSSHRLL